MNEMVKGVLRPTKNGGFSFCSSPENLVGKGRCNHILRKCDKSQLEYKEGSYFLDISNSKKMKVKEYEEEVQNNLHEIKSKLEENEKEEILSAM